jgi:ABC-type lipoprotein release transport system permease subunit
VAVILVVPLLASLLATVSPAAQAARIRPAAALRISN